MTQVAESVEAVWNSDPRHRGYDEDLELHQNAKNLVEEITDALRSSRNIFNDRGTIESALRDALESCSYQEEDLIQISYRESHRRNRRQTVEYVYLSTFPVHWDELELDQEINSIEEEIARIEEQKLLLKRSSSFCSIDISGSESNSDVGSLSQSSSSADEQSEDEDRFLPPLASATKRISLNRVDLCKNAKRRKIEDHEDKRQKSKRYQKSSNISTSMRIKQEQISTGASNNSLDSNSSSLSSSPIAKKPIPTSSPMEKKKHRTEQVFQIEQVLKLKSVVASDENEDEDIDILN